MHIYADATRRRVDRIAGRETELRTPRQVVCIKLRTGKGYTYC